MIGVYLQCYFLATNGILHFTKMVLGWITGTIGAYEGIGYDDGTSAYVDCGTGKADNWAGGLLIWRMINLVA